MEELINKKVFLLLKQFGLEDQENKAYMFLLKEGETSVPKLAKSLKISKSTAYYLVDKLKQKGFVCEMIKGKKNFVLIDDPKKLKFIMEEQERRQKMKKLNVNSFLIPTLERLRTQGNRSVIIRLYEGKNGVKKGIIEILTGGCVKEVFGILSLKRQELIFSESFLKEFYENFISGKSEKKLLIAEAESSCLKQFKDRYLSWEEKRDHIYIKKMPILNIPEDIYIFGDTVLFLNLDIKGNYAAIFKDRSLSMTLKSLFKIIWEVSESC